MLPSTAGQADIDTEYFRCQQGRPRTIAVHQPFVHLLVRGRPCLQCMSWINPKLVTRSFFAVKQRIESLNPVVAGRLRNFIQLTIVETHHLLHRP